MGIFVLHALDNLKIDDMFDAAALTRWKQMSKSSELTDATAGPATDGTPVQVTDTTPDSDTGPPLGPAADATLGSATDATPHQATDLTLAPLTRTSNNQQGRGISFEQLMLASINRGSGTTQKRKKVCEGAEIITGEEVLNKEKTKNRS
ncbi:hypothetical protein RN001_004708 [Aquatica leii]|uniref:Uncharacterized protein n=1 Tax=Aquatica leii TaxID=1421715 RepID=A0AAN7PYU4_9COLE|nr:hypothetical protein RN001_004708 [Aquatica leii]